MRGSEVVKVHPERIREQLRKLFYVQRDNKIESRYFFLQSLFTEEIAISDLFSQKFPSLYCDPKSIMTLSEEEILNILFHLERMLTDCLPESRDVNEPVCTSPSTHSASQDHERSLPQSNYSMFAVPHRPGMTATHLTTNTGFRSHRRRHSHDHKSSHSDCCIIL